MPRYYCDYCDTYLTHDSPSVRKQHNAGYKHKANVRQYYQQFEEQQTQSLIDQRIKEHLGQAAAFHQVGAAFNQHLMAQQPRFPVLPTPGMPIPGNAPGIPGNAPVPGMRPLMPGIRPPVLPRPLPGTPGFVSAPTMPPPMIPPPGAPTVPGQMNTIPGAPTVSALPAIPGSTASNGAPSMVPSAMYQTNPMATPTGGYDGHNANPQAPEGNH